MKKTDCCKACLVLCVAACYLLMIGCNSNYVPRPKGYFKINFPPHQYQPYYQPGSPYSFEYPVYANVLQDTTFFDEKPENPWWKNIDFPQFNARLFLSYKAIPKNDFSKMVNDAFKLTYKHTTKATYITDSLMATPNGVHGVFFSVGGNAATAKQFFLSDTVKHFLRAALYFDAPPNEDSLGIVNEFLLKDVQHFINSFRWRNG